MKSRNHNILLLLQQREKGVLWKTSLNLELQKFSEDKAANSEMQEIHCKLPSSVRSTFLMSFSPDSTKVASTHGDHKIYVCDVRTGKLLHKLEGHPRTPWCLAFHPTSNDILASGCLGGEVRVWDFHGGSEKWGAEPNSVITSLTFHPLDKVLVIATNNEIHFWDWSRPTPFVTCKTASEKEKVRFVKFNPLGTKLITGISNPVETYRSATCTENATRRESSQQLLPSSTSFSTRRSLLSRLMSMYQHIEGLEELSRLREPLVRPSSPTQEEALNQARHYAEVTTQASRLEQQLREQELAHLSNSEPSTSGSQQERNSDDISDDDESRMDQDLLNSQEEYTTSDFWRTFQRLRCICTSLERRMRQLQSSSNRQVPTHRSSSSRSSSSERNQSNNSNSNSRSTRSFRHVTSEFLVSVLTRIQNSLQFSALTTAIAQEQIQQLRWRISEILERLTNVTGYRARLTNLREQIFEVAERTEQRGEDNSPVRRWDLAHCLWLVEMSLQLTRQMQRILQADYRLTQLHLSSTSRSSENELNSSSSESNSSTNASPNNSFSSESYRNAANDLAQINHRRLLLMQVNHEIGEFQETFRHHRALSSLDDVLINPVADSNSDEQRNESSSSSNIETSNISRSIWPRVVLTRTTSPYIISSSSSASDSERSRNSQSENSSLAESTRRIILHHDNAFIEQFNINSDENNNQSDYSLNRPHSSSARSSNSNSSARSFPSRRQSNFYVPSVQIEPSPSEDFEPLPVHERPRSPPLSAILSGSGDLGASAWGNGSVSPYLSFLYEAGMRRGYGIHEAVNNFTHRIQSWDFSKYEIPEISNSKANIIVPKCKIHNDASVDISKDGKLLVALIPTSGPNLSSLTFGVYSLNPESLGHCLYTWVFDSNAISVSLSPLGQYVVVGLASPRLYSPSSDKEAVAQIFRLRSFGKTCIATHVRSLTQQVMSNSHHPQVSLNSVQWLPQPGQGLIYGTNRGCLCICKPVAPMNSKKMKIFRMNRTLHQSLGIQRGHSSSPSQQMFSTATQTVEPQTHTTGTQTLNS